MEALFIGIGFIVGAVVTFLATRAKNESKLKDIQLQLKDSKLGVNNIRNSLTTCERSFNAQEKKLSSLKIASEKLIKDNTSMIQKILESEKTIKAITEKSVERLIAFKKCSKTVIELETLLEQAENTKAISRTEAKKRLVEMIKFKGFHEAALKKLGLKVFSQEELNEFLINNPDENDIKLLSELGSYLQVIGKIKELENRLK